MGHEERTISEDQRKVFPSREEFKRNMNRATPASLVPVYRPSIKNVPGFDRRIILSY